MSLREMSPKELNLNPFEKLKTEWALLSAGDETKNNTMTVSWGGLGVIWNKNVVTVYVSPPRYTYEFCESEDMFSLSFHGEGAKGCMKILGTLSGRDGDKLSKTKLSMELMDGVPYIKEAELVFICKKLYHSDIDPKNFYDPAIESNYPEKDYHRLYMGEIVKILAK